MLPESSGLSVAREAALVSLPDREADVSDEDWKIFIK
jgi:hypothetical protein